jgi:hypothetical protein
MKEREEISMNFVEDIGDQIVKLLPIDMNNPILPDGKKLDIRVNGELDKDSKITIDIYFDSSSFTTDLEDCDDYIIQAAMENNQVKYLVLSSSKNGSSEYNAIIWSYSNKLENVLGFFNHEGSSLYYDNNGNIIFHLSGINSNISKANRPIELKYFYNIDNMLIREIRDEKVLELLSAFEH